ncbi:DNA-directed RNA polymerases II, IV and V subunit 9A-like [Sesbania bispinosa]|nr:DNA-directed RNA polymerases II, IV and V subunit 9A-like [Sesbania bispinosa]
MFEYACDQLFAVDQEIADNNIVYRSEIHHSNGRRTQAVENVAADPTLPRTKSVRCSQCNHGEAVFFQVNPLFYLPTCYGSEELFLCL